MEIQVRFVFCVVLATCLVHVYGLPYPLPKDSSNVKQENIHLNRVSFVKSAIEEQTPSITGKAVKIPGQVWCDHEGPEPVEAIACQEHCIPKGYAYGLCISNKCSCV